MGVEFKPLWFDEKTDEISGDKTFVFNDKYFDRRDRGDWHECPQLF